MSKLAADFQSKLEDAELGQSMLRYVAKPTRDTLREYFMPKLGAGAETFNEVTASNRQLKTTAHDLRENRDGLLALIAALQHDLREARIEKEEMTARRHAAWIFATAQSSRREYQTEVFKRNETLEEKVAHLERELEAEKRKTAAAKRVLATALE